MDFYDVHNLSTENNKNHSDYILAGSLVGVVLLCVLFCSLSIGIAGCAIHHKRKGTRDNEREMPVYDTISPDYESAKHKNIIKLSVNDAYSM